MATASLPPVLDVSIDGTIRPAPSTVVGSGAGIGGGGSTGSAGSAPSSASASGADSDSSAAPLQTLDEPISSTVLRDLKRVATKLRHVIFPVRSQAEALGELRDWDLWGPLLLCLILSM